MKRKNTKSYRLDNSAMIHIATMRKNHSNCYRFTVELSEDICPETLSKAVELVYPRFPMIVAGIEWGFFRYKIRPLSTAPKIVKDTVCLATMSKEEMKECAIRILYSGKSLSVEVFHSLTDGHGAITFLKTLLAEYLHIRYGIVVETGEMLLDIKDESTVSEEADDYHTYASDSPSGLKTGHAYLLPGTLSPKDEVLSTIGTYDSSDIVRASKYYDVSVTTLLSAVMMRAVAEIQKRHYVSGKKFRPVQIMVPINLRKLFPSKSLRNFSLYALPKVDADETKRPLRETLRAVKHQFASQFTKEYQSGIMATHVRAEFFLKMLPMWIKCAVLKIAHDVFGDNNSALTLTNLGIISFPEGMKSYVNDMYVVINPRRRSPYNCGVVSIGNKMNISISRKCMENELSEIFFVMLDEVIRDAA